MAAALGDEILVVPMYSKHCHRENAYSTRSGNNPDNDSRTSTSLRAAYCHSRIFRKGNARSVLSASLAIVRGARRTILSISSVCAFPNDPKLAGRDLNIAAVTTYESRRIYCRKLVASNTAVAVVVVDDGDGDDDGNGDGDEA